MRLPLSWLTSMVDIDLPLDALVDRLSASGLEVEGVTTPGGGVAGVRTARVLHHEPHPDADSLRLVDVTGPDGDGHVRVVCGASNFDVGDVVLHAPVGALIPGMTLEARTIRGQVSNGMLASARELGLGEDHAGLLVLGTDVPLGAMLDDLVPIGEPVIEIAVQPDRGDHLSIRGVARELAALLDTSLRGPLELAATPTAAGAGVTLETDAVGAFVAWTLEDVAVRRSPLWLRTRLAQCGVRSIDGVVDVTNYVMLELGQPLHAFDLDRVAGGLLRVRAAAGGERLRTLDGVDRTLVTHDLVIDDAEGPASLAGVMGGERTEVHAGTTRILLEGAVWEPASIRRTSRRLGLVSEASTRFERRVDPAGAEEAVARAAALLHGTADARATAATSVSSTSGAWLARPRVVASAERIASLLALDLDAQAQAGLLRRAGCDVVVDGTTIDVLPPTWRGDLERPADLAEEVARLHGFAHIPAELPPLVARGGRSPVQRLERSLRSAVLAHGFDEIVTRPFVGTSATVGVLPSEGRVRLANPLAQDAAAMRPGLLDGLLTTLRRNRGQGRAGMAVMELGRIHRPVDDPLGSALDRLLGEGWRWQGPDGQALPLQPRALGLAAFGARMGPGWLDDRSGWLVEDVIAAIDEVARRAEVGPLVRRPIERAGWHPGRTVALELEGVEVGVAGQLHPHTSEAWDLPGPVVAAELLLEVMLRPRTDSAVGAATAPRLVRHPAVVVDVAVVAPEARSLAEIGEVLRSAAGALLDDMRWFDEFRGSQLPDGHRSVAFRLRLQAADRQLSDADADEVLARIGTAVSAIGASLRT
jgi:phenylalanyl-tRNA synthetase beta chain